MARPGRSGTRSNRETVKAGVNQTAWREAQRAGQSAGPVRQLKIVESVVDGGKKSFFRGIILEADTTHEKAFRQDKLIFYGL